MSLTYEKPKKIIFVLAYDIKQINEFYYTIEDNIIELLENITNKKDSKYTIFPYGNLIVCNNNYKRVFSSAVENKKDCLLVYNPFTQNYKIENLKYITKYTKKNNDTLHITDIITFAKFWYGLISGDDTISNSDIFINSAIIDDVVTSLFIDTEYYIETANNYNFMNVQTFDNRIYFYVDIFNCDKARDLIIMPSITLNIVTEKIKLNRDLIKYIISIIKYLSSKTKLNYSKLHIPARHKTFMKEKGVHHIYFDLVFETDKLIDLINIYVLTMNQKFSLT